MSPEAQRIAIAEFEGWKIKTRPCPHSGSVKEWWWFRPGNDGFERDEKTTTQTLSPSGERVGDPIPKILPDYLNDLNAIHGAYLRWSKLHPDDYAFCYQLDRITGAAVNFKLELALIRLISATAAQWAEALLRTIGKWDESK